MRNLSMRSNVGVNGLFIYQFTEDGVSGAQQKCGEISLSPYYANMFFEKQKFVFTNVLCESSNRSGTVQVLFKGNSFNITVDGTIDGLSVNDSIPFWGKGEMVRVAVLFDGKFDSKKTKNMHFVPGNQWETKNVELEATVEASLESLWGFNVTVRLEWDESYWSTKYGPQVVAIAKIFVVQLPDDGSRGPFYFEREVLQGTIENDGWEEIDIAAREGAVFVQLDVLVPPIQPCQEKNISFGECSKYKFDQRWLILEYRFALQEMKYATWLNDGLVSCSILCIHPHLKMRINQGTILIRFLVSISCIPWSFWNILDISVKILCSFKELSTWRPKNIGKKVVCFGNIGIETS